MPFYVAEYVDDKLSTRSPSTLLNYVLDYKLFFEWLIADGISKSKDIKDIPLSDLENLKLENARSFYNAINGVAATATIDADGIYKYVSQISGLGTWTHVVGSANGTLFFYNANIGEEATATLDPGGNYRYVGSITGFGRWTHILSADEGSLLFYDIESGVGAIATIDPDGNYKYVSSISGFGSWTHIAQTD